MLKKSSLLNAIFSKSGSNVNSFVLLGLILFLGVALRVYDLGAESYWVDEMYTVTEGLQSTHQLLFSNRLDQPLAYYLPFHAWLQIFGAGEISTRSFSVLAGVGSLILIYLLGQRMFGTTVGLIGVFLMTISGFQISYSQEARFYTLFQFLTLTSFYFLVLSLESRKGIYFVLYCLFSILTLYCHTYGVFVLAAQNLYFLVFIKKHRDLMIHWFVCQVVVLSAFIPYFYFLAFGGTGGMGGTVSSNSTGTFAPSLLDPLRFMYRFIMPARETRDWMSVLFYYAVALVFVVVGMLVTFARVGKSEFLSDAKKIFNDLQAVSEMKDKLFLVFCWLLCPVILPFILSFLIAPMYRDRYTICAAPALYLLLALAIYRIRKVVPILVSLGALIVVVVPGLYYYYVTDLHQQWREAAAYIKENSDRNEVIVFAGGMGTGIEQKSFNWYYRNDTPNCTLSNDLSNSTLRMSALSQCVSGYDHFWVLIRNSTDTDPTLSYNKFFQNLNHSNFYLLAQKSFIDVTIYSFGIGK
jgi:mannosyltransferase